MWVLNRGDRFDGARLLARTVGTLPTLGLLTGHDLARPCDWAARW